MLSGRPKLKILIPGSLVAITYNLIAFIVNQDSFGISMPIYDLVITVLTVGFFEEIYELYKRRWSIETYYDYFKNRADYNTLKMQDYYMTQGLAFIMLVSSLIYRDMQDAVDKIKNKTSNFIQT